SLSLGSSLSGRTRVAVAASDPDRILSHQLAENWKILRDLSLSSVHADNPAAQHMMVLKRVIEALKAERGFLYLGDEPDQAPLFRVGQVADGSQLERPEDIARSVVDHVFRNQQPLLIRTDTIPHHAAFGTETALRLRTVIAAPLNLGERSYGVLYLDRRISDGVFVPGDEQRLHAFASHAALAFETARLARLEMSVEEACRETGDLLQTAARACGVALLLVDTRGRLIELGETVHELAAAWGSPETWWACISEQVEVNWSLAADGVVRMISAQTKMPSGESRRYELTITGSSHTLNDGRVAHVALAMDITRRRQVVETLRSKARASASKRERIEAESLSLSRTLASFSAQLEDKLMHLQEQPTRESAAELRKSVLEMFPPAGS
ncbi:MAG: GAF domain-containing protein, partial [Nannocystaceae bacterium]